MAGSVSVTVDVDISDVIEEIPTDALIRELEARARRGEREARLPDSSSWREWTQLADLIAAGEKTEALQLLASLSPHQIIPTVHVNLFQFRRAA